MKQSIQITTLKELFFKAVQLGVNSQYEDARLGRATGPGTYQFEVPGRPHYWYVRIFRGDQVTVEQAINMGAPRDPDLPVLVGRDPSGELFVTGVNPSQAAVALAGKAAAGSGPHSHAIGSGNEDIVESMRLQPGLVYPTTGLTVRISPFFYVYNGTRVYYGGGTTSLSSNLPASAGQWRWVVVCLDQTTNLPALVNGSDVLSDLLLTPATAAAIDCGSKLSLMAIQVYYGQTALDDIRRFLDMRLWLNKSLDNTDASTITYTPADAGDWPAGDPGNLDDALDVLAQLYDLMFAASPYNTSYDVDASQNTTGPGTYLVDTSTSALTVTLDTADALVAGIRIIIKDRNGAANTRNITIDTEGAETIEGSASLTISTNYGKVFLVSYGGNWLLL